MAVAIITLILLIVVPGIILLSYYAGYKDGVTTVDNTEK